MMGTRLTQAEIDQRLSEAREHEYNPEPLGELWGLQRKTAASWLRDYCRKEYYKAMYERSIHPVYPTKREKPEWENEWVNDLQVLDRDAYCQKYKIGLMGYYQRMYRAEREHGEIATPKKRAMWDREYWEKM